MQQRVESSNKYGTVQYNSEWWCNNSFNNIERKWFSLVDSNAWPRSGRRMSRLSGGVCNEETQLEQQQISREDRQ